MAACRGSLLALYLLSVMAALSGCEEPPGYWQVEPGERHSGGEGGLVQPGGGDSLAVSAYSQPMRNLTMVQRQQFALGNSFFTKPWSAAEIGSKGQRQGLGPLFNAASCQGCHIRDGRSLPAGSAGIAPLLKIYLPPSLAGHPAANYGSQLQNRAVGDLEAEGQLDVRWQYRAIHLDDGERIALRWPEVSLAQGRYGPLPEGARRGLRIAPPMIGLGLLEAIDAADVVNLADPDDSDGDGISGRVNRTAEGQLGRFGWKARQPSVAAQSRRAFAADLGVGSAAHPHAGCALPQSCADASGELTADVERAVVFYAAHLAVPERRWHDSEEVLAGKRLFHEIGCAQCHRPSWRTAAAKDASVSEQLIWPYSDLLLHDMGEGLADGIPEAQASGREWRSAPLWGLHLAKVVSGSEAGFLHDGRARSLKEAIVWHGGEAQAASLAWQQLPRAQREQLIWFLKSL